MHRLLGVALAALAAHPAVAQPRSARMERAAVEVKVSRAVAREDQLIVEYRVENASGEPVWIVGAPVGMEDGAYVELDGGRATLLRIVHRVPEDLEVEAPVLPSVTRLAPGAARDERIVLPLPLEERNPYARSGRTAARPAAVQLRIGWLPAEAGVREPVDGVIRPKYADAMRLQRVAEATAPVAD